MLKTAIEGQGNKLRNLSKNATLSRHTTQKNFNLKNLHENERKSLEHLPNGNQASKTQKAQANFVDPMQAYSALGLNQTEIQKQLAKIQNKRNLKKVSHGIEFGWDGAIGKQQNYLKIENQDQHQSKRQKVDSRDDSAEGNNKYQYER